MSEKRVYKHAVPVNDQWHTLELTGPIVHIDIKEDPYQPASAAVDVCVWAENGQWTTAQLRKVRVFGTGQDIPHALLHIGSTVDQKSGMVWHLYEDKS